MGKDIKNIKMVFPEDSFIASPGLKKNKKAFDVLKDVFSGKSIDVDVSRVPDEEILKSFNESEKES